MRPFIKTENLFFKIHAKRNAITARYEIPTAPESPLDALHQSEANALKALPFDEDYSSLNMFLYALQENDRERFDRIQTFWNNLLTTEPTSPWQSACINGYRQYQKYNPSDKTDFTTYVITIIKSSFPDHYAPISCEASFAERQFPSADVAGGKDENEFAHFFPNQNNTGGIMASHVPHQFGGDEHDRKKMQCFLEMLWRRNVTVIIALGGKPDRLSYRQHQPENGRFHATETNQMITLMDTENNAEKKIHAIGFSVEDACPLNLSDDNIHCFLNVIYPAYQNGCVLIHCDSGVGRTGMLNAFIQLYEKYNTDLFFQGQCNGLLYLLFHDSKRTTDIKTLCDAFFRMAIRVLSTLRKKRFSIQTHEQFTHLLPQFIVCLAIKHEHTPSQMKELRAMLAVIEKCNGNTHPLNDIGITVEEEGESDSSSVASTPAQSFPRKSLLRRNSSSNLSDLDPGSPSYNNNNLFPKMGSPRSARTVTLLLDEAKPSACPTQSITKIPSG
ncbi:MAG: hypothetical protein COY58_09415 [Gammaproteobacteria bacterium CG_4_10_14_0_8_um_filter_38_16]|nr:MAG: hypothetical protein COY58_09415 [Gammaproteobacteria bacterium CG_4_10_14_0_8_um_filter_38_16]PJA03092.1 MAG: hypothetical protein COX72_07250 [Gammaproteobacteria bacterium CG_4_10_14_0_2_um_filter_38_22]PJB10288.1 MAG: hypothetical protein CO120_05655 [Gammaproteobacteria bacterium CG_4_9_14_3_um_filter_38_9]